MWPGYYIFIDFANFYQHFISGFSKIAVSLTSILKTTGLSEDLASNIFRADDNKVIRDIGGYRADKTAKNSFKSKKSKNKKFKNSKYIGATRKPIF